MDFLDFSLEVKANGDAGQFVGLASTYGGEADAYGDVVMPGAFTATLQKRGHEIPILWAHDGAAAIGLGELTDTKEGLAIKGQLDLDVQAGREAYSRVKKRIVRGLSIGFRVFENGAKWVGEQRQLTSLELFEVSLTAMPANRNARVTGVKGDVGTIRAFETFLHQAGWSRSEAKKLASHGWAGLNIKGDEAPTEAEEYLRWLRSVAA